MPQAQASDAANRLRMNGVVIQVIFKKNSKQATQRCEMHSAGQAKKMREFF
jgi:hypothetical protein